MNGPLFKIELRSPAGDFAMAPEYRSIEECVEDPVLATMLSVEGFRARVMCGDLVLTGDITSLDQLQDALVTNAVTMYRRKLGR
jgi:hypothetical protein